MDIDIRQTGEKKKGIRDDQPSVNTDEEDEGFT